MKKSGSEWLNSGNALIQHLSENEIFVFSCFCQVEVVQKDTLFEVAQYSVFGLLSLSVTFLRTISKSFKCVKVIASQRWDVFETRCSIWLSRLE